MLRLNLPALERLSRLALGLGLAAGAWMVPARPNVLLVAIGTCVALTGLVGFCPACAVAGRGRASRH